MPAGLDCAGHRVRRRVVPRSRSPCLSVVWDTRRLYARAAQLSAAGAHGVSMSRSRQHRLKPTVWALFLCTLAGLAACGGSEGKESEDTAVDVDNDGDGFSIADGDCDDTDPDVRPYPGYIDSDGDLYGAEYAINCRHRAELSEPPVVELDGDCDDTDPTIHPGATDDPFDGVDSDCDSSTPEQPGDTPPQIVSLTCEGQGVDLLVEDEAMPTMALEAEFSDVDGNLHILEMSIYMDEEVDGMVDTTSELIAFVRLDDGLIPSLERTVGVNLAIDGDDLAFETTYEWAMVVEDSVGTRSAVQVVPCRTPPPL